MEGLKGIHTGFAVKEPLILSRMRRGGTEGEFQRTPLGSLWLYAPYATGNDAHRRQLLHAHPMVLAERTAHSATFLYMCAAGLGVWPREWETGEIKKMLQRLYREGPKSLGLGEAPTAPCPYYCSRWKLSLRGDNSAPIHYALWLMNGCGGREVEDGERDA